jgi:protein-S-isoprenylcysteine O-methyltransferase Ste14
MEKKTIKHLIEWLTSKIGVIWAFIGIIAGVIFPMLYIPLLLSSSWILFASVGEFSWANTYLKISITDPRVKLTIYIVEGIIFFLGLLIFCWGLWYLVIARYQNQKLVSKGPYKYIRHPQNLGILLMCLPFALYSTNVRDPGIRFGDVLSWILMVSLMCISALIEEKLLISQFGGDYVTYRAKTGFLLPKIRKKSGKGDFTLWKSLVVILAIYICIVLVCFGIQQYLFNYGLVEYPGMW